MDLFDLVAKITLETGEYERGLDDAEKKTSGFGKKLKSGLAAAGKIAAAGLGVAGAAVVSLGKQAIEAYANYEQLVGGAELMFGDAFDFVQEKAAEAYKNVQMSQNDYLQQVNSFATGLKTALGGNAQAAAELADKIITAEADVVAATGNSQEAVQNAFNGIMKSNFTMLDNLQLGITPTKEGFQEVIDKVNEWNAANGKATNYQIDNLADAQAALVDYIDMVGVAGYANAEASKTIQGSLASMGAAWHNLVVGVADKNADFETLVGNFTESVGTAAKNILPRISIALKGIGQLVKGLAPVIAQAVPMLVKDVLPTLLDSATTLLMTVVNTLVENLPALFDVGLQAIMTLADALIVNLPTLIPALVDVIMTIVDKLTEPDTMVMMVDVALRLILALAEGLVRAIPKIVERIPTIIVNIVKALIRATPQIVKAGFELLLSLGRGLVSGIVSLERSLWQITSTIREKIANLAKSALTWGKDLIDNFVRGIKEKVGKVVDAVKGVASKVKGFLGFSEPDEGPLSNFHTYAPDMMALFAEGIKKNEHLITDQIAKSFDFGNEISNIGLTGNGMANNGTTNTFGAVSISIYPKDGQSADDIAEAVMDRIQAATNRRAAALT